MIATLLLFLGESYRFVLKHRRAGLIALAAIALLVGVSMIRGCWVEHKQNEVRQDLTNANSQIEKSNINAGIIETERDRRRQEVKDAETNSKKAAEAVNSARHNDSSNADRDASAVKRRFCAEFPDDSLCR